MTTRRNVDGTIVTDTDATNRDTAPETDWDRSRADPAPFDERADPALSGSRLARDTGTNLDTGAVEPGLRRGDERLARPTRTVPARDHHPMTAPVVYPPATPLPIDPNVVKPPIVQGPCTLRDLAAVAKEAWEVNRGDPRDALDRFTAVVIAVFRHCRATDYDYSDLPLVPGDENWAFSPWADRAGDRRLDGRGVDGRGDARLDGRFDDGLVGRRADGAPLTGDLAKPVRVDGRFDGSVAGRPDPRRVNALNDGLVDGRVDSPAPLERPGSLERSDR